MVASLGVAPGVAAGGPGETDNPFEQGFNQLFDDLGADFPVAVSRAIDRGYSGTQVVTAVAVEGVAEDGVLTTTGTGDPSITPAEEPAGLIAGDGEGPGTTTPAEMKRTIKKTMRDLLLSEGFAATRDRRNSVAAVLIIGAALAGYSAEQIIVDGFLSGDSLFSMGSLNPRAGGEGNTRIINRNGDVLDPEFSPVVPTNTFETLHGLLDSFTTGSGGGGSTDDLDDGDAGSEPATPKAPKAPKGGYAFTFEGTISESRGTGSSTSTLAGAGTLNSGLFSDDARGPVSISASTPEGSCGAAANVRFSVVATKRGKSFEVEVSVAQQGSSALTPPGGLSTEDDCDRQLASATIDLLLGFPPVKVPVKGGTATASSSEGTITFTLTR